MTDDPAAMVGNTAKPGGVDCSCVLEKLRKLGKKWEVVVLMLVALVVVLMVIVVVLATLLATTTTTSTQQPSTTTTTTPPPPPLSSIVGNDSAVLPLDIQQRVQHHLQRERALPGCRTVNVSLKVLDVLQSDPSEEVLDGTLLTHNIVVTRCQGWCARYGVCRPMHARNEDIVVLYLDTDGALKYIKRQVLHHRLCRCLDA